MKVAHQLFKIVCFEYRVLTVQYFMDDATMFEIEEIINAIPYLDRNQREMARYDLYLTTQVNTKKKIKPTDIMSFEWDSENIGTEQSISNDDISRLKEKAQQIQQIYFSETEHGRFSDTVDA